MPYILLVGIIGIILFVCISIADSGYIIEQLVNYEPDTENTTVNQDWKNVLTAFMILDAVACRLYFLFMFGIIFK